MFFFFFSSRRRHTRWPRDWSSDVCSSDLGRAGDLLGHLRVFRFGITVFALASMAGVFAPDGGCAARRPPAPLIPRRVVRDRNRSGANTVLLLLGAGMLAMSYLLTLYMQLVRG